MYGIAEKVVAFVGTCEEPLPPEEDEDDDE